MDFVFFIWVTLIKIANPPHDRLATLVLSIINWTYCKTAVLISFIYLFKMKIVQEYTNKEKNIKEIVP